MPTKPSLEPLCRDEGRRANVLAHPVLNGIDYLEYEHRPLDPLPHVLVVHFLKPLPDPPHSNPDGAYGLTSALELVRVEGGERVMGIRVVNVQPVGDHLEIAVDRAGDFSIYELLLGWVFGDDGWAQVVPALDDVYSRAPVDFKAGCPVEFDCRVLPVCPPEPAPEPRIDYLAKDYASFRRLLLDRLALLSPGWTERNPSDLGMTLVELLAYEGDHISYAQDAVANEAFLDTVRQRVSAKRHGRLVDYRMHDGRNAWTHVHVSVADPGAIPRGTEVLSRVAAPLRRQKNPPGTVIPEDHLSASAYRDDPALRGVVVFETTRTTAVHPENGLIRIHAWGNLECCHPRGTTSAHLYSPMPQGGGLELAVRPVLEAGDFLLVEEVRGPSTGASADADPSHRQVVRIVEAVETEDDVYSDQVVDGELQTWQAGDTPLPLLKVSWDRTDALAFPLCLSARPPGAEPLLDVSVARGNLLLCDHGRTVQESFPQPEPVPPDSRVRLTLGEAPLTLQRQPEQVDYDPATGVLTTPRHDLRGSVAEVRPAISVRIDFPSRVELWRAVPDLLDSPPFAQHFVVDVDERGRATLRFGDGEYGREVAGAIAFTATYRVGNGPAGNAGAEALSHLVRPTVAPGWPTNVLSVRNPLAARDGVRAETIEEVRQFAPAAFHSELFRAVTEEDYAGAARKLASIVEAVATFRWTGSWYTVFVGVDPRDPGDLIRSPGGATQLTRARAREVHAFLTRYRLAGYDLEIRAGDYVPLELELHVCAAPGHFRGDVTEAVRRALRGAPNPDGSRGFFHRDRFTFGQPVHLSRVYAAVEAVEGVDSVVVTVFRRWGETDNGELARGLLELGPWEIARLEDDPSFPENGALYVETDGGK